MDEKRVLVTGVTGFLGGHVALALLRQGYAVRGSLRNPAGAERCRAALRAAGANVERLEFCKLDLLDDDGWDEAAAGCRYLQHVASPFFLQTPKDENALIAPAVEGTRRALRAALRAGHERIVVTSSIAAIDGGHGSCEKALTAADWTVADAPGVNAYARSKTLAERAAWTLAEAEGARTRLATVNPGMILGPLLDDDAGTSVLVVQRLLKGDLPMVPDLILPYVDVRDVAEAHAAAMTAPEAAGRRHLLANPAVSLVELARMLREAMPAEARRVPTRRLPSWMVPLVAAFDKSLRDNRAYIGVMQRYDSASGAALLGRPLRSTQEALLASAESLIERRLV